MPGCDPMTGINTPSSLKARTITWHTNTSDTEAMTNKTDKNQYLPTWPTLPQAGPDTELLGESEGPVGPPLPHLPPVDIHKEEHLLFLFAKID